MNIILWILQVLLALLFAFAGVTKFLMPAEEMLKGAPAFMPIQFFYFIGVCEILGAIGLVIPWLTKIRPGLTPLAASLLIIIMIGATIITAMTSVPQAIVPLVVGILCTVVARGRSRTATTN